MLSRGGGGDSQAARGGKRGRERGVQKRGRGGRGRKREGEKEKRERERRSDMFAIIRNFMVSVRRTGTFLVFHKTVSPILCNG